MRNLALFAIVGGVGFLVDVAVLYLLLPYVGALAARLVSFLCAVLTTWLLNRTFTFKASPAELPSSSEFLVYLGLMLGGGALNYGVYAILIFASSLVSRYPVLGVAVGSVVGIAFNFMSSRRFLYKSR